MITTRSPFSDPEFLRSVNMIPFDTEVSAETMRWDEMQAAYRFSLRERHKSVKTARMLLGVLAFAICSWAAAIAWLCL